MNNYTLVDDFTISGVAWLPQTPSKTMSFECTYHHQALTNISITVSGKLSTENIKTLFGVSHVVGVVTMHELTFSGSQTTFSGGVGLFTYSFVARHVIIGQHIQPSSSSFNGSRVRFTYMDEWIQRKDTYANGINCSMGSPDTITLAPFVFESGSVTHDTVSVEWEFRIEPSRPQNLEWFLKRIESLQKFLSIMMGRPSYAERVSVWGDDPFSNWRVFFSTMPKVISPPMHPGLCPIQFEQFAPVAHSSTPLWLQVSDTLKPTVDLYAGVMFHPNQYIQLSFLSLVLALESYHRRIFSGKYVDDNSYESAIANLVSQIPSTLDPDHRQSLKNRLKFGNEYSLRKRLRDLLKGLPPSIVDCLISPLKPSTFVDDIVSIRNEFVHEGEVPKTLRDIMTRERQMRHLIAYLLLKKVGIGCDPARIDALP